MLPPLAHTVSVITYPLTPMHLLSPRPLASYHFLPVTLTFHPYPLTTSLLGASSPPCNLHALLSYSSLSPFTPCTIWLPSRLSPADKLCCTPHLTASRLLFTSCPLSPPADKVAMLTFEELCGRPLAAADYLALAGVGGL